MGNNSNGPALLGCMRTERLIVGGIMALLGLNGWQTISRTGENEATRVNARAVAACQETIIVHTAELDAMRLTLQRLADQVDDVHAVLIRTSPRED